MKHKHQVFNRIVLVGLAIYSSACLANYESFDNIKNVTMKFINDSAVRDSDDTLNITVNQTDATDKLPICTSSLHAALPENANRNQINSIELSCNGERSWKVFVPVTVIVNTKVVVAKNMIPQRNSINDDDLDFNYVDKNRLYNGFYKTKEEVLGFEAAQVIPAGTILTKRNLQLPLLVHRNETVDLIAGNGAIMVTMKGLSRTDGRLNEVIKAYNPVSNKSLDAVVIGEGKAKIVS